MTESPATSYDVRAELEDLLERDLLGPWDGPTEELPPGVPPAERYLLGRLVPRSRPVRPAAEDDPFDEPELVDREITAASEDPDEDVEAPQVARSGTMAASALGLSFRVPVDVERITLTATWGHYAPTASEVHVTEQGKPRTVWKRTPAGGEIELDLTAGDDPIVVDPDHEGVVVRSTVRIRGGCRIVDLALINDQLPGTGSADLTRTYQTSLRVTALDGVQAIFVGHNDPDLGTLPSPTDDERLHLAMLYRERREYAHGRQCAVDAEVHSGETRAWRLTTTSFPAADVPLTVAGDPATMPGVVLDMARLGSTELARDDLVRSLRPLATFYRTWLATQRDRLDDPEISRYAPAGEVALGQAHAVADRLDRAIDLLREDGIAREAFRFANQAMALQRVRSEVTRVRAAGDPATVAELVRRHDIPKQRSWRPFQLAFVLLCLPGLTDPRHSDARRGSDDGEAQLLFFPTGGGKTEAYLGLTAYTFAIRRLQGVVGADAEARDGSDGVAVLMRYTLRLLTAQQFQRAAALVCACEWLRRERIASGDGRWGHTPFRVGLWVGSKVTPNTFDEAKRQIEDAKGQFDALGGPLQLAACPWCGERLSAGRDLRTDDRRRRVLLFCSDPEGDCPFSPRHSPDEGIPVLTVDEELYRLTPALVIGTVDKFAQLPWRAATSTLFGHVDARCARHGWKNPDFDGFCKAAHQRTDRLPATQPEAAMRLRPPDLIIQDELHLIADALGSMVGLYETTIDDLASRTANGRQIRPVLVASTATVRRARDQVEEVFARGLTVFPPQILDAGETFFSTVRPPSSETPSRRYRGVCATGERLKAIEIRVVAAIMEHAQSLLDRYGQAADPYLTLVDYFSSTRELAGMRRLVEDDIAERLASQKVRTRRRRPLVSELTARMPSSRIASTLAELERPFDAKLDSSDYLDQLRQDRRTGVVRTAQRVPPIDVLLATSMLQVGVDVQRLGLMVVTGQPKSTAEYIQATSRVGRDTARPGLVLAIYQWARPRDLAHFESFAYGHARFGMRVEGLTTTPFSDRALDRGMSAALAAAVRHRDSSTLPNVAAATVPLTGPAADRLVELFGKRAERVTHDSARGALARKAVQKRLDSWTQRRATLQAGVLGYRQAPDVVGLLKQPDEHSWDPWTAPLSLREVEPEVLLQIDRRDNSVDDAPGWTYDAPQGGG
ncbi:MAG: DISARM system helicase DrmA [Jatrophihabitans sp.]